jgi:hypothetical protein
MTMRVLVWALALASAGAAFQEFPDGMTNVELTPVQSGPPPSGDNFYMKVFRLPKLMTADDFKTKYIAQTQNNLLYELTHDPDRPDDRKSFQSPPKPCRQIWDPLQVKYLGQTYGITEDPRDNTQYQSTAARLPFPIKWVRDCPSTCPGCFFESSSSYIAFMMTNDESPTRTVFAYGICLGWIQVDCTTTTTCSNGQYASNYLNRDPFNNRILNNIQCNPCQPGTWNTCLTPTLACSW